MTARTLVLCSALAAFASTPAFSQNDRQPPRPAPATPAPPSAPTPPAPPPAPPAPAAPAARRTGQPINIKVDLTIVDTRGGTPAERKTVSVVVADGMTGFIRYTSNYTMPGSVQGVPFNVDVEPQVIEAGKIRLRLNLQYDLPNSLAAEEGTRPGNLFTTQLRENLSLILENGKSIIAAQSADPVRDRQVTVEVTATVLK